MTAVCSYVEYMANEWVRLINRVRGTGSICLMFSYIVCATNRRQILSCTEPANEVNKTFIIRLLVHFYLCSCFISVRLQMLPFTLPLSLLVSLHVYTR